MSSAIATVICIVGIVGLFILARDPKPCTSKGLWIPTFWLLITGSRPVAAWLPSGLMRGSAGQHNVDANPVNVVFFSLLVAAGIIVLIGREKQVRRLLRANWPIFFFFAYCGISTLWSDYPDAAFRKWIRSVGDLIVVLIVLTEIEPTAALMRLVKRTGFVLLPLSVLFIKFYPNLGRAYSNSWEPMYTGVTDNKNTLGALCLILGLGFFWSILEHYRAKGDPLRCRRLVADGTLLTIVIWLLWMAQSVTSRSCFAMAATLIAVTQLYVTRRKLTLVRLLVVAMVGVSLFALFGDTGGELVESLGRNPTLTGRTAIWQQVVGMAGNPVFGTGFESFWLGDRLQGFWDDNPGSEINEAHNGYLEVYLNLGWCGVTLLGVLILNGYRNITAGFRRDPHIAGLKMAYFVAAVIYALTEAGFRMLTPVWIFFLLATIAVPQVGMTTLTERTETFAGQPGETPAHVGAL